MDTSGTGARDRDSDQDRAGLDIGTAARQLGISPAALKKRVQRGQQPAYKRDGRWQVLINGVHREHVLVGTDETGRGTLVQGQGTVGETGTIPRDKERGQAVAALERALEYERRRADEAVQQVIAARETAAMYQERVRNLEEDNRRLTAQLALPEPTPTSPPDPVEALRAQVEQLQARLEAPRAPWWRFWRRARVNRLFAERLRQLCRQLDQAAAIGPRTERALVEATGPIDAPRTLARWRAGTDVVVLRNGAELRRCETAGAWVYALGGAETPL